MNAGKTLQKPLILYYSIAMIVLLLCNFPVMPWLEESRIQLSFADKEEKQIYKTVSLEDPGLICPCSLSGTTGEKPSPVRNS